MVDSSQTVFLLSSNAANTWLNTHTNTNTHKHTLTHKHTHTHIYTHIHIHTQPSQRWLENFKSLTLKRMVKPDENKMSLFMPLDYGYV